MRWIATFFLIAAVAYSQGVTTATIYGKITSSSGEPLAGVTVVARHDPSGTVYGATTRSNGEYTIPGMRVGGPYTLRASIVGYQSQERGGIYLQLSQSLRQDFILSPKDVEGREVVVVAEQSRLLNASRTGAGTAVD